MEQIDRLIDQLSRREESDTVFNQYKDEKIANNLKVYLKTQYKHKAQYLFLGEASGYKGCRASGIPFTSGELLCKNSLFASQRTSYNYYFIREKKESTSSIVYSFFNENPTIFNKIVMFNTFPFHPHKVLNDKSNRTPKREEINEGLSFLKILNNIFKFKKYIAIGNVAYIILVDAIKKGELTLQEIKKIRHPSFGGKNDFNIELKKEFRIKQIKWKSIIEG